MGKILDENIEIESQTIFHVLASFLGTCEVAKKILEKGEDLQGIGKQKYTI